ncbi:MAG: DUF4143 domain-containing protein [Candidatus Methanoplasma sp.]|jgi:predicted AAA+ superfamily ATPase|nr:DUF4143 domain-containing protein [Candidatus Methanoplasma sp.]
MRKELVGKRYRKRVIDERIETVLRTFGGVVITGPKWCGKSWTGIHHSKSALLLDNPMTRERALLFPEDVLAGPRPLLVDEWQNAPVLWDTARRMIDFEDERGMFIFTGSITPPEDRIAHTGIGRFARVMMRPMSLYESGHSSGSVSLSKMFGGTDLIAGLSSHSMDEILTLICRGGWPSGLSLKDDDAFLIPIQYVNDIAETDMDRIYGERWLSGNIRKVLRSLARNNATEARVSVLVTDVSSEGDSITADTASKYLDILKRMFIISEQEAWSPYLRSRTRVRTSPKRHFTDPSLAAAALGATPSTLKKDPETAGFLFETLCYRDLCVYMENSLGKVYHYRDESNLEVDCVLEGPGGKWAAVEVKMGYHDHKKASANLLALKRKASGDAGEPAFLMILTASGGAAHVNKDGVAVVPIDCLGP